MNNASFMYKAAILLAIGAGFISVSQSYFLRTQLRETKENLISYEKQMNSLQKERHIKSYENGYKKCLIDIYNNDPHLLITKTGDSNMITIWRKEESINPLNQN